MKTRKNPAGRGSKTVPRVKPSQSARSPRVAKFPIVGIGASAGGLEALEQFIRATPVESGMAFVIIQHLDPTRIGLMPEILQRASTMKVTQAKDRTKVCPNQIYVIPPNKNLSILRGVLHLLEPTAPRGLRLPINFFFRSLAEDQEEQSVGVILSGMGSDGTLGLRAIKEKGGLVLVQEPATAKFAGMPDSAIESGLADIVAPAEELPARISAFLQHPPLIVRQAVGPDARANGAMEKVIILLRARTRQDFSLYKRNTLFRRVERRMGIHQIDKMAAYVRYLQENPQELDLLYRELLIGVTNFFRDPAVWEELRLRAIPALFETRNAARALRAWVPGCSTGEEAYSLAITFKEAVEDLKDRVPFSIQIFATDLDRDGIERARQGIYSESECAEISPERLSRFFTKEEKGCRVRKEIREMVIFAPQNLVMDPPFTKLDILCCRNLLIYLLPEVQKKLIPLFHYSLNPNGLLVLGSAETIGGYGDLFDPVNAKLRLYRRSDSARRGAPLAFPSSFNSPPATGPAAPDAAPPTANLQSAADQLILQRYAPPSVLVDDRGDILYVSGRTGKFLEPAAGKANWNLFAMVREGLRYELVRAFEKAVREKETVAQHGLRAMIDGAEHVLDITIYRPDESRALKGLYLIVFTELPRPSPAKVAPLVPQSAARGVRLRELKSELQRVRDEARNNHEEMQTAQEEFRSANEELQSTNEELQSTNEELTTSKEEMQSLNEELQTVNAELQSKVDENVRTGNDMKNLLDSTDIATLFLDNKLNVRRFTPQAAKIIKLMPRDVGRSITDLVSELSYPSLADDVKAVLHSLTPIEQSAVSAAGRWFTVRVMPYRTLDDRIDGVVITFSDITVAKTLEARLRSHQAKLEKRIVAQTPRPKPKSR